MRFADDSPTSRQQRFLLDLNSAASEAMNSTHRTRQALIAQTGVQLFQTHHQAMEMILRLKKELKLTIEELQRLMHVTCRSEISWYERLKIIGSSSEEIEVNVKATQGRVEYLESTLTFESRKLAAAVTEYESQLQQIQSFRRISMIQKQDASMELNRLTAEINSLQTDVQDLKSVVSQLK